MELGLKGKKAVVTGGSKGIGFATASLLAVEGADVAIIARNKPSLEEAAAAIQKISGREVIAIAADVSKEDEVRIAAAEAAERLGGADILVNNAGTAAAKPFSEVSADAWTADLDLKLFGAVHFTRELLPYLKKSSGAAVVNVTAIGGKTPGASSLPTSVSRAAGLALTKAMSKDLAVDGIRVNAVCIGLIRSDQIEKMWRSTSPELTWEQFAADPRHDIPLGRIGKPEEAANVIAFLVSEAASYISGTAINIDGGKANAL